MKTVRVSAGIICRNGDHDEVLAVQRGYGDMEGLWEFPGGKIERGESAEDACKRELAEELQVSITNLRDFYTVEYDYPDFHLSMECFFCELDEGSGEPKRSDRQMDMRWVKRSSLATLTWMPADEGLVDALASTSDAEAEQALVKRRHDSRHSMQGNRGKNTKPELVMEAFYGFCGQEFQPLSLLIHRMEVYGDLGEEGERKLVSLEDLGEEIE